MPSDEKHDDTPVAATGLALSVCVHASRRKLHFENYVPLIWNKALQLNLPKKIKFWHTMEGTKYGLP
jgi:hypothetical protein